MKQTLLSILRNKEISRKDFRDASKKLSYLLAGEIADHLEKKPCNIQTPLAKAKGSIIKDDIILVPILRSGIALLSGFIEFFEQATVGFVGLQRDEKTAIAKQYYCKIPIMKPTDNIVLLDPMIATGGSAIDALKLLKKIGAQEEKIYFSAIIAAKEGIVAVKKAFPKITICITHVDDTLNDKKFIVPGLGDFGDRYFGTEEPAKLA